MPHQEKPVLIDSYHTLVLEHRLSAQCVVLDPGPLGLHHRLPLRLGHMNLSLRQIEDEIQTGSSSGGY